jgi:hypothetical protein
MWHLPALQQATKRLHLFRKREQLMNDNEIGKTVQELYDYFDKRYTRSERRYMENDSMKYYGECNAYADAQYKIQKFAESFGIELVFDNGEDN